MSGIRAFIKEASQRFGLLVLCPSASYGHNIITMLAWKQGAAHWTPWTVSGSYIGEINVCSQMAQSVISHSSFIKELRQSLVVVAA